MTARWLLAYDATCGTCRSISKTVGNASAGRLVVVPLSRPAVVQWRRQVFGDNPPWRPTLLRVGQSEPRAWTGTAMAIPLLRCLGMRTTLRVLTALGRERTSENGRTRRGPAVLKGIVTAGVLLMTGRAPTAAAQEKQRAAQWVADHQDALPTSFADTGQHTIAVRKAIYTASPPEVRLRLWTEALEQDRDAHSSLTSGQLQVFADAIDLARDMFTGTDKNELTTRRTRLRQEALRQFGQPKACHMIMRLTAGKS